MKKKVSDRGLGFPHPKRPEEICQSKRVADYARGVKESKEGF